MNKKVTSHKTQDTSVIVSNFNSKHKLNGRFIKELVKKILKILREKRYAELEVIFLSDAAIGVLNKKFKYRDRPTDVLSFDLGSLGEVVISSDTALKNSRIFRTSFETELTLYIIHGILHLAGYEDGTATEKRRMSKKEDDILAKLCRQNSLKALTRQ